MAISIKMLLSAWSTFPFWRGFVWDRPYSLLHIFYTWIFRFMILAFQDLHIMVFLGFGLIMTFLKRYSRGMLVQAFLIGGLVIQWATLLQGFFSMRQSKVELTLERYNFSEKSVTKSMLSLSENCRKHTSRYHKENETHYFYVQL